MQCVNRSAIPSLFSVGDMKLITVLMALGWMVALAACGSKGGNGSGAGLGDEAAGGGDKALKGAYACAFTGKNGKVFKCVEGFRSNIKTAEDLKRAQDACVSQASEDAGVKTSWDSKSSCAREGHVGTCTYSEYGFRTRYYGAEADARKECEVAQASFSTQF